MGGNRNDRNTRSFEPEELERLARESVDTEEQEPPQRPPSEGRATTVQDPLTMALLAEVARNARTQDFDPADMPSEEHDLAHPNLKRR